MGVASGCGCKEVYKFPHITYPYSSCSYLFFLAAVSLLYSFLFLFFALFIYIAKILTIEPTRKLASLAIRPDKVDCLIPISTCIVLMYSTYIFIISLTLIT